MAAGLAVLLLLTRPDGTPADEPSGQEAAPLPPGVKAVWGLDRAYRETTPTRERAWLNGLWRWQPAGDDKGAVPVGGWGYFKVPGFWPGNANYLQEDAQALYPHPSWRSADLRGLTAAWSQREITVPEGWAGRRVAVCAEYVNSFAAVYIDGKKVGELRYPAGEVDVSAAIKPGGTHVLTLLVTALPLKGVLLSYTDTNAARAVKGTVDRRGLCGDLFLASTPAGPRLTDLKIDTSVRKGEITFAAALEGLAGGPFALRVRIEEDGRTLREVTSKPFKEGDLKGGRLTVTEKWRPAKLWDVHTPQNTLTARVELMEGADKVRDALPPVRFGFRELWIDGRDFYLNGTRLYLSAVPLDNAQVGARAAS
jgi:hypothetical protein